MANLESLGELALGSRLARLSEHLMRETQAVYTALNIDFDPYLFPVFRVISDKKETNTSEITSILNVSQPAITQMLNKLQVRGFINQDPDASDGRKKIVSLSDRGNELLTKLRPVWEVIDACVKEYTTDQTDSLIEHIALIEKKLVETPISHSIVERYRSVTPEIVPYRPELAHYFKSLNVAWLERYFVVEPHDNDVLSNPEGYILNRGGDIFFAKLGTEIVGTVALINEGPFLEMSKMAVDPGYQGRKIGHMLIETCIETARKKGWKELILYSNSILKPAIHLYQKYGFEFLPVEKDGPYRRSDIKMRLSLI